MHLKIAKTGAHIELTGRCNLKCKYCYNQRFSSKDEFSKETLIEVIEQCKKIGVKNFTFSGGEPFLYRNLFDIIALCKNCYVSILTNGTLLSEKLLYKIKEYDQIKELKISLDGFEGHNKIRVGSKSDSIIQHIKNLKKILPDCFITINTIITKENIKELQKLYFLLRDIGIQQWRVDMPFYEGRYKQNYNSLKYPSFEKIVKTLQRILVAYFKDGCPFKLHIFNIYNSKMFENLKIKKLNANLNAHPCAYNRRNTFTLKPDGSITVCPSLGRPLSNIYQHKSVISALKLAEKHDFFRIKLKDMTCKKCRYLNICEGGCRADAYYWVGSLNAADPLCCSLLPLVEKYIWPVLPKEQRDLFLNSIIRTNRTPNRLPELDNIFTKK